MQDIVRQAARNIFSSGVSLGVRILLVFLVNPFIIHTLGNDRYGIWVLIVSIVNYMTILDLGLKQALIRFIAKYLGLNDYNRVNSILNCSFIIYSVVSLLVIVITLALSFVALDWFNIPAEYVSQGRVALIIIGISTALNFALLAWGDSLGAFHRFDVANGLMIFEDIFRTITIVVLLKSGYGLIPFALTFLVFSLLRLAVGAGLLKKLHPPIRFDLGALNKATFRMLFDYGIITFFISIAWLLIANTSNVLIGYFLDAESITKYAIAAGFVIYLRSLIQAISFPLRPIISHYEALGKSENVTQIYTMGTKYLYFLAFVLAGGTMVYADDFIRLWMGPGYEQSAVILKILIIPAAFYLPQSVANSVLFGTGQHRKLLYMVIIEGVLNVGLSIILINRYGLSGIAWGAAASQLFVCLLLIPPVMKSVLNIRMVAFYRLLLVSVIPAFLVSGLLAYLLRQILAPANWFLFFGEVALVAALSAISGYLLADKEELRLILKKCRNKA